MQKPILCSSLCLMLLAAGCGGESRGQGQGSSRLVAQPGVPVDAGVTTDAGPADAGHADGGVADAGPDAGPADGGCSCPAGNFCDRSGQCQLCPPENTTPYCSDGSNGHTAQACPSGYSCVIHDEVCNEMGECLPDARQPDPDGGNTYDCPNGCPEGFVCLDQDCTPCYGDQCPGDPPDAGTDPDAGPGDGGAIGDPGDGGTIGANGCDSQTPCGSGSCCDLNSFTCTAGTGDSSGYCASGDTCPVDPPATSAFASTAVADAGTSCAMNCTASYIYEQYPIPPIPPRGGKPLPNPVFMTWAEIWAHETTSNSYVDGIFQGGKGNLIQASAQTSNATLSLTCDITNCSCGTVAKMGTITFKGTEELDILTNVSTLAAFGASGNASLQAGAIVDGTSHPGLEPSFHMDANTKIGADVSTENSSVSQNKAGFKPTSTVTGEASVPKIGDIKLTEGSELDLSHDSSHTETVKMTRTLSNWFMQIVFGYAVTPAGGQLIWKPTDRENKNWTITAWLDHSALTASDSLPSLNTIDGYPDTFARIWVSGMHKFKSSGGIIAYDRHLKTLKCLYQLCSQDPGTHALTCTPFNVNGTVTANGNGSCAKPPQFER